MNMEFLESNFYNTTTMITTTTGTSTVGYLFDRNADLYFQSLGDPWDSTLTTLTITFPSAKEVNRIIVENINAKALTFSYGDTITNLFSLTSGDTLTTWWQTNSATSLYLVLAATKTITSITLRMQATIVPNEEKKLGQWWVTSQVLALEHNPSADQYVPIFKRKSFAHEMSDGGTALYIIDKSFKTDLTLLYQSDSMTASLLSLYNDSDPFVFVPYPTTTGWSNEIYEVNWVGDYSFKQPAKNNIDSYAWKGEMSFEETPK